VNPDEQPTVSIVFLVYNRREELRESLQRMLLESDYPRDRVEVIVVDNASTDGAAEMVREEFPDVQLMVRDHNVGVSGWNEGLAAARGDWVLALDDDCYLPPDGLRRAVAAAQERDADLVSFKVVSTRDPSYVFTEVSYQTGLFTFWGCAVLLRREVVEALGGYDPEIFYLANELEFTIRFFDHGFRHLHLPEVVAQHMKAPPPPNPRIEDVNWSIYLYNARHFGYIAAKLLRPRDAAEALVALLVGNVRDWMRGWVGARRGPRETIAGFAHGLRHRAPVNARLSRFYRRNFLTFVSPWQLSRSPLELMRAIPREAITGRLRFGEGQEIGDRRERFFRERAHLYPKDEAALLDFRT
jgi:GT2 family glycosyltransferase